MQQRVHDSSMEERNKKRRDARAMLLQGGKVASAKQQASQPAPQHEDNMSSLDRSIAEAMQATQRGEETLVNLDSQRRQMNRMDRELSDIDNNLTSSERVIRSIKSWTGSVRNWFGEKPKAKDGTYKGESKPAPSGKANIKGAAAFEGRDNAMAEQHAMDRSARNRQHAEGNTQAQQVDERQQEMHRQRAEEDDKLDLLSDLVGNLNMQAQSMSHELDHQNKLLDHIGDATERNASRIQKNTGALRKIK